MRQKKKTRKNLVRAAVFSAAILTAGLMGVLTNERVMNGCNGPSQPIDYISEGYTQEFYCKGMDGFVPGKEFTPFPNVREDDSGSEILWILKTREQEDGNLLEGNLLADIRMQMGNFSTRGLPGDTRASLAVQFRGLGVPDPESVKRGFCNQYIYRSVSIPCSGCIGLKNNQGLLRQLENIFGRWLGQSAAQLLSMRKGMGNRGIAPFKVLGEDENGFVLRLHGGEHVTLDKELRFNYERYTDEVMVPIIIEGLESRSGRTHAALKANCSGIERRYMYPETHKVDNDIARIFPECRGEI